MRFTFARGFSQNAGYLWPLPYPCCSSDLLHAVCRRIGEGRATISPTSWLSQKPQLSKGEVIHAFDPCYCYHLFTDQHFKPYLWLAGHVSGLSESGYSPCGFLMIYLDKICGMREMKLSAPLYGTSVHVRKWKYFQKQWRYFDWWHKLLRQRMSLKRKKRMPNFYNKRQKMVCPGKASGLTGEQNEKESKKIIEWSLSGATLIHYIFQL